MCVDFVGKETKKINWDDDVKMYKYEMKTSMKAIHGLFRENQCDGFVIL